MQHSKRGPHRTLAIASLGALLVAGAATFATTADARGPWGFGGGRGHHHDPEAFRERVLSRVERRLEKAGASEAQIGQASEIVEAALDDLADFHAEHRAGHHALFEALTAETIDRDALERIRAEQIEQADRASRRFVTALADVAEILDPEQRAAIAEHRAEHRAERRARRSERKAERMQRRERSE